MLHSTNNMSYTPEERPGVVTLITVLAITAVSMAAFLTLTTLTTNQLKQVTSTGTSEQVYYAAEAGINDGLYKLSQNPGAQTYTLTTNSVPATVTITVDATDPLGKRRIIDSVVDFRGTQRKLRVAATTNALASSLQFAVQSGNGGIDMANGSEVWGNLYANGPITGGGTIYGDVWNSGAAGSTSGISVGANSNPSPSNKCSQSTVTDPQYNNHNLRSHSLSNMKVFGKAFYQTVTGNNVKAGPAGNVTCTAAGNGTTCVSGSADPAATSYPITQQQIDEYKNLADDNTVAGNVDINGDTTLTSRKIVGNLSVTSGTLTITGPIWVTGIIDIDHPGITIRLPASAGEASGVIMSDQSLDIKNNATLMGSGNAKSFLLMMALKNDVGNWVIRGSNNSTAVVYFAPDGLIEVSQNAGLNNTTGKKIVLQNNSCVQYDPNLGGFFIPGGPPIPISPQPGTWKEL